MITQQTIDLVFNTVRVEDVISDYIQLKKAGSNYKGLSPFITEKTPSFVVSPSKQIWKDFSSGKGGNAVTFLIDFEGFNYRGRCFTELFHFFRKTVKFKKVLFHHFR